MRRQLLISFLVALFLLPSAVPARSAPPIGTFAPGASLRFEHLTIDDGLTQNAGLALLQDHQGFMWIGSQDGLNRYDGYNITQFKHDPDDPDSLGFNGIASLYEDPEGNLWIGTWGGGLDRFDARTSTFTHYVPNPEDPDAIINSVVTSIIEDGHGGLWVGTLGGLEHFIPTVGKFTHVNSDPISAIYPMEDGALWLGTGAFSVTGTGLYRFDPATNTSELIPPDGECFQFPNVSDIVTDPQGNLWISYGGYGVAGGGIDRYYPKSGKCTHFDSGQKSDNQITDDNITDLLLDRDGAVWATSWSGGVWRFPSILSKNFSVVHHDAADPESLSNDNTFSILQDRSGVVWIGTLSAGVNKLNPDTLQFRTYRNKVSDPESLASNHVGAFAETSNGTVWVGTWEKGLERFNPSTGKFKNYLNDPDDPQSLSSDLVMSLLADDNGTLWVGTLGGGLNHLDPTTGKFTRYLNDPNDPASLLENQVTYILSDPAGRLWIGTFLGLSRLDPGASKFVNYPMSAPPVSLEVIEDELWIGSWGGGVSRLKLTDPNLDPARATFSTLMHDPANPNSLSENSVWGIEQTADGVVWLGTQGGLNRYDPKTGDFKVYNEKNGLRNSTILTVNLDKQGFLWLTTNNGLAKFDPQTETFRIYDKSDGLQGNEFNSNAAFFSHSTGDMYVGGVGGFSIFDPTELRDNTTPPNVVITDFSIFNAPQSFDASGNEPIRLGYDQNFISFEFAALDFQSPQKNQYAYKLEGIDKDWVQAGTRNYASYTNLPGGDYTFRVKASNSDGVWNEEGVSLKLIVVPPFWQTLPFQIGVAVGLILLVVAGFRWRVSAVREQNTRLQKMVDEQQRVEAELRDSEAKFRAMFESAAIGMALGEINGNLLAANAALCKISGYTEEELKQRNDRQNSYPEDEHIGLDLFAEMMDGRRDYYSVEKRYVRKTGEVAWARLTISLVRDSNGQPSYLVNMVEDIDEQKTKSAALAESEARFRTMFETSAIGIGIMGLDGKVINVNPALCKIFGYACEELVGQTNILVLHPEDSFKAAQSMQDLLSGKIDQFSSEQRYIRKNGEAFWARITMSMVHDAQGAPLYIVGMVADINEERLALGKLQESEARFRAMFDNAAVGISIISPEGKTLAVNPVLVKLSGRTEAELIEVGGRGVTYPDDQEAGMAEFNEILTGKRDDYQVEKRYVHKDGRIHWMRQSVSAVRDEAGKVRYMIVIAEDIEERKRALEELRESEARFRAMFESSAIGMGMSLVDGNMLAANAALCKISGYTEEELKQRSDLENCYPDDAQVGMDLFMEMLAGKRDYYSVEKRYVRKNGEVFWTRLTLSLVRDPEGKPSYLLNMVEDIDDQKKKSEALRESEARFRSMFDNAAVGVAVMTLDRHITQINQRAAHLTGYTPEEIGQIDPSMLAIEDDRYVDRHLFTELVSGKRDQYTAEKRYYRKDKSVFWGRVNFSLVRGADGKPLYTIGIIEDITEEKRVAEKLAVQEAEHRRQLEQRITERTEELNLANERLREKAAQDAVAAERTRLARDLHDAVTQTLFSTTLIADVLPDIWEMNPPEGRRRLEELRQLTRGALAEMRTLLVELRPNALVEVPLPTLLRQLTEALSGRARINIQLSAEGERKLPADVQVSLYRIAQEALNNVFKHAKASEAVVTLRMGDAVRLTVADNGSGFDPSTVTADHLGVKIMRERADVIGAKLSIYSEPGEGTQISVVWQSSVGAG